MGFALSAVKVERRGYCGVCHRALKDPKYVALGIGPICARKQGVGGRAAVPTGVASGARATYTVEQVESDYVVIRDTTNGKAVPSVTNDAEAVVAEVAAKYPNRRIYYYDSCGRLDQLVHDHGKFQRFAFGGPT